jgi:DNA-binding LytR/AlgR family response regulator
MKVVIIEDEKPAARKLERLLSNFTDLQLVATLHSVEDAVDWFSKNEHPKLIFSDIVVKMKLNTGKVMTYVIEVKPHHQTQQPERKRKTKKFISEQVTYIINQSKWKAADEFCQEHGWQFKILTEKELGIK